MKLKSFFILCSLVSLLVLSYSQNAFSNIIGVANQNLVVNANQDDLISVHTPKIMKPRSFTLGVILDFNINALPFFKTTAELEQRNLRTLDSSKKGIKNILLDGILLGGYGINKKVDISIFLPYVLLQKIKYDEYFHGEYTEKGFLGIGLQPKINLYKGSNLGLATILTGLIPFTSGDFHEGKNSYAFSLEIAANYILGNIELAGNTGFKYRNAKRVHATDDPNIEPLSSQVILGAGLGYKVEKVKTTFSLEYFGAYPIDKDKNSSDKDLYINELILGGRTHQFLDYTYGVGTRLNEGVGSPVFRIFAGLAYSFKPKAKKVRKPKPAPEPEPIPEPVPEIEDNFTYSPDDTPSEIIQLKNINFAINSAELIGNINDSNIKTLVTSLGQDFKQLIIEGHTCNLGKPEYNLDLSRKRAETIKNILVKQYNIPAQKIQAIGYGMTRPIASNDTEAGRIQNRRVEFKIFR